jgi:hypothetical protein
MEGDRRKSFRCSIAGDARQAELLVGKSRERAVVADESRDGLGVWVESDPGLKPGETACLTTSAGTTAVGVVDCRQEDGRTRLGLVRLGEAPPRKRGPLSRWLTGPRLDDSPDDPGRLPLPSLRAGVFCCAVVGVALGAWWLAGGEDEELSGQRPFAGRADPPTPLPASALLTLPTWADRLELSPSQRERIDLILARAAPASNELKRARQHGEADRASIVALRQLESAAADVDRLLTQRQRDAWRGLLADAED